MRTLTHDLNFFLSLRKALEGTNKKNTQLRSHSEKDSHVFEHVIFSFQHLPVTDTYTLINLIFFE